MSVDLKMVSIPPAKGPLNNRENDDKPLDLGYPIWRSKPTSYPLPLSVDG